VHIVITPGKHRIIERRHFYIEGVASEAKCLHQGVYQGSCGTQGYLHWHNSSRQMGTKIQQTLWWLETYELLWLLCLSYFCAVTVVSTENLSLLYSDDISNLQVSNYIIFNTDASKVRHKNCRCAMDLMESPILFRWNHMETVTASNHTCDCCSLVPCPLPHMLEVIKYWKEWNLGRGQDVCTHTHVSKRKYVWGYSQPWC